MQVACFSLKMHITKESGAIMKLRAIALKAVGTLALGAIVAAWAALLPCAGYLDHDEPPPFVPRTALALESQQPVCAIGESVVGTNAANVAIKTPAENLRCLLLPAELAALDSGAAVSIYLTSTALIPRIPAAPTQPPEQAEQQAGQGQTNAGAQASNPAPLSAKSSPETTVEGTNPADSKNGLPPEDDAHPRIDLSELLALTTAAERLYNFSSDSDHLSGYYPFDISLFVKVGDGTPRKATGTLAQPLQITVEFTRSMIAGIKEKHGIGDEFTFFVFHGHSTSEGFQAQQLGAMGTQDKTTITIDVNSFSPFIIAWGDTPPVPVVAPAPPSTGTTTPEPTPPIAPPSTPEPAPDDPAIADDTPAATAPEPFLAWSPKQGTRSVTLRWTQVEGADGYLIYRCRCNYGGVKRTPKLAAELPAGTSSWTFRNLRKGCWYKHRVAAFKLEGGQRVTLATSPLVHASTLGGKSLVASGVQIVSVRDENGAEVALRDPEAGDLVAATPDGASLQVLELAAGQQVQLSTRETGRKLTVHHRGMRFASSNKAVASVTRDGRLVAHAAGTCRVWAYAQSGVFRMIELRVA